MDIPQYAELHCISSFTFLRGASHPEELVQRAAQLGYGALAITDECSLAGVVRAHVAAKTSGIRLLIGTELRLVHGLKLFLIATERESYGDLCELVTQARRAAPKGEYRLHREDLEHGLGKCLSFWLPGKEAAEEQGRWIADRFRGRAWIAVELLGGSEDRARLQILRNLGQRLDLPLVASGDVHMHRRSRRAVQDTLTAIRLGRPLAEVGFALHPNGERHLRSRRILGHIYPPELLTETLAVSERCQFSLDELRYEYPAELVPEGRTAVGWLRHLTEDGLARRWPGGIPGKVRELVEHELALIEELHYAHYFLTVQDIVAFARSRNILCQGRGSAANSAVCYSLGITEVDPARMDMLFERFISRERNEPPDIDVDFEHERREEVIQYVYEKYGRNRAALAATVITYRGRSAMRDVGKALGLDPVQLDRLAGCVGWEADGEDCDKRLQEAGFEPSVPHIRRLRQLVSEFVGFPRHLSQHVGGFVISRGPLCRLVPIENAAMEKRTVIQWDKDDLDMLGLLKVDCLALGMLTAIHRALNLLSDWQRKAMTLADIPAEDPAVYEMIENADTMGVFQIESRAQMAMLPRLQPRCFYDLVIEVAIVRPGPIQGGMVHPYLRRRTGEEPVTYPNDAVREVLERTLGVPIFQEQVMQLAVVAAGFTPGEADQLRRSMAAWRRRGNMEGFKERFVEGMLTRGYSGDLAERLFRQIQGFGEYGFPESHAASFSLLVYVSAWLKRHHPAIFCCALLNSQPMGFYAPAQLVQDARRHGVEVRPVDVQKSGWDCTLELARISHAPPTAAADRLAVSRRASSGRLNVASTTPPSSSGPCTPSQQRRDALAADGREQCGLGQEGVPALRLGLRMIKGLSHAGADRLIEARPESGYRDVDDLARRARLDKKDLQALGRADALVSLAGHRHQAAWSVLGIENGTLLGELMDVPEPIASLETPGIGEELVADYASIGFSLRRHPLSLLRDALQRRGLQQAEFVRHQSHGTRIAAAGLVINRQRPSTAGGVIFLTLEDETGHVNVIVQPTVTRRQRPILLNARLLKVDGVIEREGRVVQLLARKLEDLTLLLGRLDTRSRDFH